MDTPTLYVLISVHSKITGNPFVYRGTFITKEKALDVFETLITKEKGSLTQIIRDTLEKCGYYHDRYNLNNAVDWGLLTIDVPSNNKIM